MDVEQMTPGQMVWSGSREVKVDSVFVDANGEIGVLVPRDEDGETKWYPSRVSPESLTASRDSVVVTIDGVEVTVERPLEGETETRAIWPTTEARTR